MTYLTKEPIVLDPQVWTPSGAVVSFLGVVRPDRHGIRQLVALWYEACVEMAEQVIDQAIAEAKTRWALDRVVVQHRLGQVAMGEVSVAVLVAAQHRAEAYAGSRYLIDAIKHDAPIWKREAYDDGSHRWTRCDQGHHAIVDKRCYLKMEPSPIFSRC